MIKIGIDAGHGGSDPGAIGMGFNEKDITLDIALRLKTKLESNGSFAVALSRDGDWRYSNDLGADLTGRANALNNAGVHAVISIHMNSAEQPAGGTETYTWNGNNIADGWGNAIHNAIITADLYNINRGRKWANFAILRETWAVACLVEMAFINSNDVYQVVGKEDAWAQALYTGICDYFGVSASAEPVTTGTPIVSEPTATVGQMATWAKAKNAAQWFIDHAQMFYDIAKNKDVNPAGVYAQSAKETGYGKFGGVIDETFKNPCGLKTSAGGGDYDQNAHQRFTSWEQGITAQVDHLLLYAGYPQNPTPDPRHFESLTGNATTFEALSGKWAGADYGQGIVKLMKEIEATEAAAEEPDPNEWMIEGIQVVSNKFGLDVEQWLNRKNENMRVGDFFAVLHKVFK